MEITIERLRALQPLFRKTNPDFLRAYSDADDDAAIAAWLPIATKEHPSQPFGDDDDATQEYALSLWLAHTGELWMLPRLGLLPPRTIGDQPSASLSEGSVSVSWQRQDTGTFKAPAILAYTNAGSELAEMLRTRVGINMFVL